MAVYHVAPLARAVEDRSRRGLLSALSGVAFGALGTVALPTAAKKKGSRRKKGNTRDTRTDGPTCPTCPAASQEPTCPAACSSECSSCKARMEASVLCAGGSYYHGCHPCASDNDCVTAGGQYPYCVDSGFC
jgi:hypothetical protein